MAFPSKAMLLMALVSLLVIPVIAGPSAGHLFSYSVTTSGTENVVTYPDLSFSYRLTATGTETYPTYQYKYSSSICYNCFCGDNSCPPPVPSGWTVIAKDHYGDRDCGCDTNWYSSRVWGSPCTRDNTAAYFFDIRAPTGSYLTQTVSNYQDRSAAANRNDNPRTVGGIDGFAPSPTQGGTVSGISYQVASLDSRVTVQFYDGATYSSSTTNPAATIVATTEYGVVAPVPWGPVTQQFEDDVASTAWEELLPLPLAPNPASSTWSIDEIDDRVEAKIEGGKAYARLLNQAPLVIPGGPYGGTEGSTINLEVTASDPDGDSLSYYWDFNNDGTWDSAPDSPTVSHLFVDNTDGFVRVGVGDGFSIVERLIAIAIANAPPTLGIAGAASVDEGATYTLSLSSSDPGTDTISKWTIDWGDGVQEVSGNPPSVTHIYADGTNTYPISATTTDEDGTYTAGTSVYVTVNNVAPTLGIAGAAAVDEGTSYSLAFTRSDPGADSMTEWRIDWGDGSALETVSGAATGATHTYADGPAGHTIKASATDDDGTYEVPTTVGVTVNNVVPTLTISGAASVNEGSEYTLTLSASDPGADTITTWEITWGDGTAPQTVSGATSATHTYADGENSWTISATATDEDGTFNANSLPISVENVAPTLTISGAVATDEGSTYTLTLAAADPGADTITEWAITWGDGTPVEIVSGNPLQATHVYADGPNGFPITATAKDEDGTFDAGGSFTVTVNNVAPTLGAITPTVNPVKLGGLAEVSASFTDPGDDTHTATWAWGDASTPTAGTVVESPTKAVGGSHTYAAVGVYTVTLTLKDSDDAEVSAIYEYVVVYDPSVGNVVGHGQITSPAGAYIPDPAATGPAHFGFTSQYKKGATVPTGQTWFTFHVADLKFTSTEYQWLVVSGTKAQFKGVGTINGAGDYGFLVTATDGGTKGTDKFRIKIWDRAGNTVVYDNQMGDVETADPATVIENGQILVGK